MGKNSQIPCFDKICGKLALFRKYLAIYYFLSTRVSQNRVLNSTWVQWTQVPSELPAWHCWLEICVIKKIMSYSILLKLSFFIVLELPTLEYLVFFFLFLLFVSYETCQVKENGKHLWPKCHTFWPKEKNHEFGLHVRCCS